ncbi:diadenylate cyclase [Halorubrum sp. AD140]|uniref:diadenylate cyclase n=1 Tax=Halorubrum sp. AD140 TaxID=3050073 RepID=UPI002ACC78F5|nr:diadenylate cyclase [Halorubrum sp. AD140]MDZ5811459.1 diadenylate cyclase [Halorubrum sp. AD140]
MCEDSLTFRYANHPPVEELIRTVTDCVESVSLEFDQWETTYVQGPGLYIVLVAGTSIDEYADPIGSNRWPVEECTVVDHESFFETARTVALNRDGAVIITVDGTIHEQMVRLKDIPEDHDAASRGRAIAYADWMGARHMSALETSLRDDVVTTITLSGETGRVTRFTDGEYASCQREEIAAEGRGED